MPTALHGNALPNGHELHWYCIERALGQGGFGITYLARDNNLHQPVALKEFFPTEFVTRAEDFSVQLKSDGAAVDFQKWLERFLNEARTLARFDHPSIVRCHSVFESHNTAYMVMRYEEGESLSVILDREGSLTEEKLLEMVLPILDGLRRVHGLGFVHRDCQPANIYVRADGSPVLLDFGAAREAANFARTATILVSPGYAPFEQYYSSNAEQGPWTDIYSLGATLYRAVTGVAPIDAIERSRDVLASTRDVLVPATVASAARYSDSFLAAIDHALAFRKDDRPQSVTEWAAELRGDVPVVINPRVNDGSNVPVQPSPVTENTSAINEPTQLPDQHGNNAKVITRASRPAAKWLVFSAIVIGIAAGLVVLDFLRGDSGFDKYLVSTPRFGENALSNLSEYVDISPAAPLSTAPITDEQPAEQTLNEEEPASVVVAGENEIGAVAQGPIADVNETMTAASGDEAWQAASDIESKSRDNEEELSALQKQLADELGAKAALQNEIEHMRKEREQQARSARRHAEAAAAARAVERAAVKQVQEAIAKESERKEPRSDPLDAALRLVKAEKYAEAVEKLSPLAEAGEPVAQFHLARLYHEGHGVLANNTTALKWMRNAAWQGSSEAQVALAQMYARGINGIRDHFLAYTWFLVGERNGAHHVAAERGKSKQQLQPEQVPQASGLAAALNSRASRNIMAQTPGTQ